MHRLIARFLSLAALVGNVGPLALAAIPPSHSCCVRKAAHHCRGSQISETGYLLIRDVAGCNHDCCRAVTTAQWAHSQMHSAAGFAQNVAPYVGRLSLASPNAEVPSYQSTRAPPHL